MSWDFLGLEEAIVFCNFEESERICLGNFLVLRRQMFIAILWNLSPTSIAEMEEEVITKWRNRMELDCSVVRRCCRTNPWDKSIAVDCAADTR